MKNEYRRQRPTGEDWREDLANTRWRYSQRQEPYREDQEYLFGTRNRYSRNEYQNRGWSDNPYTNREFRGTSYGTGSYPAGNYRRFNREDIYDRYNRSNEYGTYNAGYYNPDYHYGHEGYGYNRPDYEYGTPDESDYGERYHSRYAGYSSSYPDDRRRYDRDWWDKAGDEVASWFGDEDAERRRRMDEQRNHRGRGPKGYQRSDDRIREDVNDRLTDDPWIDASDLEVTVDNGEVVLSGEVFDRYAKRRAEDLTETVLGVGNVENRIRVKQEEYRETTYPTATTSGGATNTDSRVENGKTKTTTKSS